MSRTRIVTVAGDINLETILAEALPYRPDVELVLRCIDRVELLAAIRGGSIDAILLVGSVEWFDKQLAAEASRRGIGVVAITDNDANERIGTVLSTESPLDEIVRACADRPLGPASPAQELGKQGRITAIWGPKGAPGRSRLAIELSFVLHATDASCLLMDADPYGGDVLQILGVVDELPTIIWAAQMAAKSELDKEHLAGHLKRVDGGPVILPGIPRADLWPDVSEFGFGELLAACRSSFSHTVIDTGFCIEPDSDVLGSSGGRNRMARIAIEGADRVVAVCDSTPIGIRSFLWSFEALVKLVDPDKIVLVANRVRDGQARELSRLLFRHTGKRPGAYLPNATTAVEKALEEGSAVVAAKGSADFRAGVESLAVSVGAKLRPRGVLTRLGARK